MTKKSPNYIYLQANNISKRTFDSGRTNVFVNFLFISHLNKRKFLLVELSAGH